jgi:hypothetical protein
MSCLLDQKKVGGGRSIFYVLLLSVYVLLLSVCLPQKREKSMGENKNHTKEGTKLPHFYLGQVPDRYSEIKFFYFYRS